MESILIIDDDESFGETLEIFLTDMGCRILRANNGKVGLDIIESEHPDIVITDYKMPQLNGLQVLKRIKEIDTKIQVIMLTAFEDMDSTIKAMQLGAYDYVEKLELERIKAITKRCLLYTSDAADE